MKASELINETTWSLPRQSAGQIKELLDRSFIKSQTVVVYGKTYEITLVLEEIE